MKRLVIGTAFLAASCIKMPGAEEKPADSKESDKPDQAGTLSVGDQAETAVGLAGSNLNAVSQGFVPESMTAGTVAVDTQSGAQLLNGPPQFCVDNPGNQMCTDCGPSGSLNGAQACADFFGPGGQGYTEGEVLGGGGGDGGGDGQQGEGAQGPCEGRGFFDCQPILVKLYLNMARQSVGQVGSLMKGAGALVKDAKDPKGTVTLQDGDEFSAIDYAVNAADDMEFLFKNLNDKPVIHAVLKGTTYSMTVTGLGDGDGMGSSDVRVEFVDDQHWTVDLLVESGECNPDDAQAPQKIAIRMTRAEPLWQGKAMMYSPHWPSGGCDDPVTDTSGLGLDTDIVGESAFTTASLFMVPLTVDDLKGSAIDAYSIQKICANFPAICGGNTNATQAMGDTLPSNPFCSRPDGTHSWGGACAESTVPDVAAGTYGSPDLWRTPKELGEAAVTVPGAL